MGIDFLKEMEANPPELNNEQMAMIADLAARQVVLEEYIAKCESNAEAAKVNLRKISEVALPNAMAEVGMSEFKLSNGTVVKVKQEVYASIPKDNTGPAFAWLREHNLDAVIKNVISVEFGKGEDQEAIRAATALAEEGFKPTQNQTVHPMTLKALLKEQMEKGVDVPLTAFGAHTVNKSKVELPKEKK